MPRRLTKGRVTHQDHRHEVARSQPQSPSRCRSSRALRITEYRSEKPIVIELRCNRANTCAARAPADDVHCAMRNAGGIMTPPQVAADREGNGRMSSKPPARDPYLVKSVVHSSQLLSAFRSSGEALPLREVAARSGLPKSMAFRLLYTLERCGMVEKVGENLYRSHLRPFKQRPYPPRLRGAGHRLPVLQGDLDRAAARRRGAGHRAHLASTTATARRSRSATPTSSCARRSIWSSSSRPTSTSRRSSPPSTAKRAFRSSRSKSRIRAPPTSAPTTTKPA